MAAKSLNRMTERLQCAICGIAYILVLCSEKIRRMAVFSMLEPYFFFVASKPANLPKTAAAMMQDTEMGSHIIQYYNLQVCSFLSSNKCVPRANPLKKADLA